MSLLLEFLDDHRFVGEGHITHTTKIRTGKYNISSVDDMNHFYTYINRYACRNLAISNEIFCCCFSKCFNCCNFSIVF